MPKERATELEYLEWFRWNADFGPATDEILAMMDKEFMKEVEGLKLKWFRQNADFGPAHEDVVKLMNEEFRMKTGKLLPKEWTEKKDNREEAEG